MRILILATATVAVLAQPVAAANPAPDARDNQGRPILPAGPQDRPPLTETPTRQAAPHREAMQRELREELEAWRERVEAWRRENEAFGGKEGAARLMDALQQAEQSWRRLAQSAGENWDHAMHQVEVTRDELARVWSEVTS